MRKLLYILMIIASFTVSAWARMAEMMPGGTQTYVSDNGRYEITITHGEMLPSWSLKQDGKELWQQPMQAEPGTAVISDNGATIILPSWGWQDEGGSKGVFIHDKNGDLVQEVLFPGENPGEETLRWVRETRISPEGKFFAIGEDRKPQAVITLFDTVAGTIIWEKPIGLARVIQIKLSPEAEYVLVATCQDRDSDMRFDLLNRSGEILWSKNIANNLSYEVAHYLKFNEDVSGFEIFDLNANKYIFEKIPAR